MNLNRFLLLMVLVASLTMIGCTHTSYGTKVEQSNISKITKGVTTRAQMEQMFGSPMSTGMLPDGRRSSIWIYRESDGHSNAAGFIPVVGGFMGGSKSNTNAQKLQAIYTKEGIVEDYEFDNKNTQTETTNNVFHGTAKTESTSTPPK